MRLTAGTTRTVAVEVDSSEKFWTNHTQAKAAHVGGFFDGQRGFGGHPKTACHSLD